LLGTHGTKKTDILDRVQKRAINMVNGMAGKTYEEKLAEIGLDSLSDRRTEADLVQIYKIIHGHSSVNKSELVKNGMGCPKKLGQPNLLLISSVFTGLM
jgi:hypothetical protein